MSVLARAGISRAENRRRLRAMRIPTREYWLAHELTRAQAERRAHQLDKRAGYGDHRGFSYDARTGRARMT